MFPLGRWLALAVVGWAINLAAHTAYAQPDAQLDDQLDSTEADIGDADLGPVIEIEAIVVEGNATTSQHLIVRALPFAVGEVFHAGAPELRAGRFKVLALGFFRDVDLRMLRGSARGKVVVRVTVVERGTLLLSRLWFGTSTTSAGWFGLDLAERNLLGTGVSLGGAAIATVDRVEGGRDQRAGELRVGATQILGTPVGGHVALYAHRGSEPYRISGALDDDRVANFRAAPYWRIGARTGVQHGVSGLTRVLGAVRGEAIGATLPDAPTREDPGGVQVPVDLYLAPGRSRLWTLSVGIERDTRPDPALPHRGTRVAAQLEASSKLLGSGYSYVSLVGRFDHWWPLRRDRHAIGVRLLGGVILGDAPVFDRISLGEVNRMVTPRALGLAVAAASPFGILGTPTPHETTGDLGATAMAEYATRLWRGGKRIYGGDLFVGAGLWMLADRGDLRASDRSLWQSLPVDVVIDAGLRVDTEVGVFELTIANAFGRVPL